MFFPAGSLQHSSRWLTSRCQERHRYGRSDAEEEEEEEENKADDEDPVWLLLMLWHVAKMVIL